MTWQAHTESQIIGGNAYKQAERINKCASRELKLKLKKKKKKKERIDDYY